MIFNSIDFVKIDELINQLVSKQIGWAAGPVSVESVSKIEAALNIALPESYKVFLQRYGAFYVSNSALAGALEKNPLSEDGGMVYYETKEARRAIGLHPSLVVIHQDSNEWFVCLDTSKMVNGECPVVEASGKTGMPIGEALEGNLSDYVVRFLKTQFPL